MATITFTDGTATTPPTILRLSTHPLNTAEGGFQYKGNDYFARLLDQNIDAVQAMSETGIDIPPTMTLKIADADRFCWANFELPLGFKGAALNLDLVLWEADTGNFSSDSYRKFTGICDPALVDEGTLVVSASSKLNMQKILLPLIPIQTRCPWIFPVSLADRMAGLTDPSSPFSPCGYSPDVPGNGWEALPGVGNTGSPNTLDANGNAVTDANGVYITCDYTRAGCTLRGMFNQDSAQRETGHFGGIEWDPPMWWKSKSYLEGKTISGINTPNPAKYSQYVPLIYGQVFVDGVVLNVIGDANSTRMEVLICYGFIGGANIAARNSGGVKMVIVNGVSVPCNFGNPTDVLFLWQYVSTGLRTSMANTGAEYSTTGLPFSGLGDPYGNLAVIQIVVPIVLAPSASVPPVQILVLGPAVRVWYATDPGGGLTDAKVPGFVYLNVPGAAPQSQAPGPAGPGWTCTAGIAPGNPIWVLMDLLVRASWNYSDLNIQSFIDAAAVCATQISYTNNAGVVGNTNSDGSPHLRYSCSLSVESRRTAADVIQGVRNSCKAMLIPNDQGGLLRVFIKQTMADQQSAPIPGSNNIAGVASIHADGTAADGYSAYDFDESALLEDSGGASTLHITQRRVVDSPNSISANFQDQDNRFVVDSMTELDPVDIARAGQTVVGGLMTDGLNNYDQGKRVFEARFAETFRGNPRGDSGGTLVFEFQTSQKVAHLQVGQICRWTHNQLNLILQKVRVVKLQPSRDHEITTITLQWHEDNWYTDTYGQVGMPIYAGNNKHRANRPPFPWNPDSIAPLVGDAIFDPSDSTFGLSQTYTTAADGSVLVQAAVTGLLPVNSFSTLQAPLIGLQGTVSQGPAGTLKGNQDFYAVVCPYDGNMPPKYAPPQLIPCVTAIPPAGNTSNFQVTIPVIVWPPGTVGWSLFAGPNSNKMALQASGVGTPSSITFAGLLAGSPTDHTANIRSVGPPDVNFDHLIVRVKPQIHAGVWLTLVTGVTDNTMQFNGCKWSVNQWAGYDITAVFSVADEGINKDQRVLNLRVASNTADTLTIQFLAPPVQGQPAPSLIAMGVSVGDAFAMRARPDTFTATTIGDSNFVNFTPGGLTSFAAGLTPNEGSFVLRIFAGKGAGQWRNVISNTATVYTVDRPFDPVPDATSRFWVEALAWLPPVNSSSVQNSSLLTDLVSVGVTVPNFPQMIVVQVLTADSEGNTCFEQYAPMRDYLISGSGSGSGAASQVPFAVVRQNYAELTVIDAEPINSTTIGSIKAFNFLALAIDETDVGWQGWGTTPDATTPLRFTPTLPIPFQISPGVFRGMSRYGQRVLAIIVDIAGSGYTQASFVFSGGGFGASAIPLIVAGAVTFNGMTGYGGGYSPANPPVVTVVGDGMGAVAHAVLYDFIPGDYCIWNDGSGEIFEIQSIDPVLFVWVINRGVFGSTIGAPRMPRASGVPWVFYRLTAVALSQTVQQGVVGVNTPNGLPQKFQWALANRLVAAIASQAVGTSGLGPVYTLNLFGWQEAGSQTAVPNSLGIRTENGAEYTLGVTGDLAVGMTASVRKSVAAPESIRCIWAHVGTAPVGLGSAITIYVYWIDPDRVTVGLLDILTITPGGGVSSNFSYPSDDPPAVRQMPYHSNAFPKPVASGGQDWPPSLLPQVVGNLDVNGNFNDRGGIDPVNAVVYSAGGTLDFYIFSVGTTKPGSDLVVEIQT